MNLTRTERLILSNQLLILQKLDPKHKDDYEEDRTVIENGYTIHYEEVLQHVHEKELPEEECKYVMDVLDMHLALKRSCENLPAKDKKALDAKELRYRGFDGNHESEYLGYTNFLSRFGKWKEIIPRGGINSHHQTRDRYERMLAAWNEVAQDKKWEMNKEQILKVLG